MVNHGAYFQAWKQRLGSLHVAFEKIKVLPKDAQLVQALVVRNACFAYIKELEAAFEVILADEICRRDELFWADVDEIRLVAFKRKPWPLGQDVPARLIKLKQDLGKQVTEWAGQSAHFEKSVSDTHDNFRREVYVIIGQLTLVYGVSPRDGKKKR